jgi:DNA-binding NarL/FixJ family response regulator
MSADGAVESSWALALQLASSPGDPSTWQQQLADAIEAAVHPDAAGVFLCTLGNMLEATPRMAPRGCLGIGERLVDVVLPRLHRSGFETPWDIFAPAPDAQRPALTRQVHAELLEPAGFEGLIGDVLRSRDGMAAGWIAVFVRSSEHQRLSEMAAPLGEVCQAAEATLRRAIGISTLLGGRFPKISPSPLSDRERQVARLAANGHSDLNIADALQITEGTVGRHLHNIFRKLGVSSRMELTDLLCARD